MVMFCLKIKFLAYLDFDNFVLVYYVYNGNFLFIISCVQVTNDSCAVHRKFQSTIHECYAAYSGSKEDHSTFGPSNNPLNLTA